MHLLQITMELPFAPGGTGGSTRQFQLISRLVQMGHRVTVAAPVRRDQQELETARAALARAGAELHPIERPVSRPGEVLSAARADPSIPLRLVTDPWLPWQYEVIWRRARGEVRRLVEECAPDVACLEHDDIVSWGQDLADLLPIVLTAHNVTPDLYASRARSARGVARALLAGEERRFTRHVRRHLPAYDRVIAVSGADAERLEELGARSVAVIPNGADFGAAPLPHPPNGAGVLFTGSMEHPPNREAAAWLAREIWPAVRAALPEARLRIVGRGPQEELRRRAGGPGIEIMGPVADMRPYYEAASVVVAPLRSGGGTRLKVLDALAAGRAVVSTGIGASGLDLQDGRDLLIADGAGAFAQATIRALRDEELRRSLAAAGRAAAAARYDWPHLAERLASELAAATGRR